MTCNHNHYKDGQHMTSRKALRELKAGRIRNMSKIIPECEKCGKNIKYARVVRVTYYGQKK